jgi:hypothetical protein
MRRRDRGDTTDAGGIIGGKVRGLLEGDLPLFSAPPPAEPPGLPPAARASDPETSHESASLLRRQHHLRAVLGAYRYAGADGLTAEEVGRRTGIPGIWRRVSEAHALGWIADTGAQRFATTGRKQAVLAITPHGIATLTHMER